MSLPDDAAAGTANQWPAASTELLRSEEPRVQSALQVFLGEQRIVQGRVTYSGVFRPNDNADETLVVWVPPAKDVQRFIVTTKDGPAHTFAAATGVMQHLGIEVVAGAKYTMALDDMFRRNAKGRKVTPYEFDVHL